jgi:chromosome segregation ATPase
VTDPNLIAELEQRIAELDAALDLMRDDRDAKKDAADSLWHELQNVTNRLKQAEAIIGRLRLHIQQGVEL